MRSRVLTTAQATFASGRRLDARHTPETPASSARLAAHAAAAAAAPHSVLGREPPRASKTRDWLRPPLKYPRPKRTRATALYINKGFPPFSTHRIKPYTLPHVPPPDRMYTYSLERALRLAHVRKIHFSTHRSLSARCDPSRVSCIPPRACAATCIAPNAPRGPHSSMTTCRAVCLCDHVC